MLKGLMAQITLQKLKKQPSVSLELNCPLAQQTTEFITGSLFDLCYEAIVIR